MTTLRVILRTFARNPNIPIVAILSLALGIGSNSAMFSLLDQILLRTLPVSNPHELVFLYSPGPTQGTYSSDEDGGPSFSYPMLRELQSKQTPFTALAGARAMPASLSYNNQAIRGSVHLVSGNYFETLGVRPALGRLFNNDDDRTVSGHPIAVLSHRYWTARFGSDPAVLNASLIVNGYPMTIVGVAAPGFDGERLGSTPEVFVPITMKPQVTPGMDGTQNRQDHWVTLFGRLKPGVSLERASTEINVTYAAEIETDAALLTSPSETFLQQFRARRMEVKPGAYGRGGLRQDAQTPLLLLLGITLMVLLIACANIANVMLVRAMARRREIALRLALGASRRQIVFQLLLESWALAIAGGLVGLLFAYATLQFIQSSLPPREASFINTGLNLTVLAWSSVLSILTGLLFGLMPALQATRPELATTLKDQAGQTTGSRRSNRLRKALVTLQIGVSLFLLISAGLLARSLVNLSKIDLGLRADHLLSFELDPRLSGYTPERTAQLYERLQERLATLPGVNSVSLSQVGAIAGDNMSRSLSIEGYVQPEGERSPMMNIVGSGYFRTMGVPLVQGREFTPADTRGAPKVAVVNESFARHHFGQQSPVGRRVGLGRQDSPRDIEIVGVVKDSKYSDLKVDPPRVIFHPYLQEERPASMHFYLRTSTPPEALGPAVRRVVAELDSTLPIDGLKTMQAQIEENLFLERMLTTLTSSFAGLATLLAAIGLYGVMSYSVARQTREIGIRMALGAAASRVRGLIVREVFWMLLIGLAIGVPIAVGIGRLTSSILFNVTGWDPVVYAAAILALCAVALFAAFVPARRAMRTSPTEALRYE